MRAEAMEGRSPKGTDGRQFLPKIGRQVREGVRKDIAYPVSPRILQYRTAEHHCPFQNRSLGNVAWLTPSARVNCAECRTGRKGAKNRAGDTNE